MIEVVLGACKRPFLLTVKDKQIPTACGKCLACRIRRRSVWTIRLLQEIISADKASFITLTYSDENLPLRGSDERGILVKNDLQKFFKRYRKFLKNREIKYYACGEYGDLGGRPHYHAIIFNDYQNKETIESIWQLGLCDVGDANEQSIRYVAGYVSKKLGLTDYNDNIRPSHFQMCSQGLGLQWAAENYVEVLANGCLTYKGKKLPVPRTYVDLYERLYPEETEGFKAQRLWQADLALTDLILELIPETGGKRFEQLDQEEKENFLIQLRKRGKKIDDDLRRKAEHQEHIKRTGEKGL